ncbi:MAG: putative metal-binding motif-containing protein, partial [Pseudomonadota bacterium]
LTMDSRKKTARTRDPRLLAFGVTFFVLMLVTSLLWLSCFSMTDFGKEVTFYDGATVCRVESEEEDCDMDNCHHCDEELGRCTPDPSRNASDDDLDTYFTCDDDGVHGPGPDCDDGTDLIKPGAAEQCNVEDDDCDGTVDEGIVHSWESPEELFPGSHPAVDWDGQNIAVVWEAHGETTTNLKFAFLTASAGISEQNDLLAGGSDNVESPSIAYIREREGSSTFGVAWINNESGNRGLQVIVVQPAVQLPYSGVIELIEEPDGEQMSAPKVACAYDIDRCAVAWKQQSTGDAATAEIKIAFINKDTGSPEEDIIEVSSRPGVESTEPAVVRAGAGFAVAWTEIVSEGNSSIHVACYDQETKGRIGDAVELNVDGDRNPSSPALGRRIGAPSSSEVILVYQALGEGTQQDIYYVMLDLAKFDDDGEVFGSTNNLSSSSLLSMSPSVFWAGDDIGVAWNERGADKVNYFALIAAAGGDGIPGESVLLGEGLRPSVSTTGTEGGFLVLGYRKIESDYAIMANGTSCEVE